MIDTRLYEASSDLVNSVREANQTVANALVTILDWNMKFAQHFFLSGVAVLEREANSMSNLTDLGGQQIRRQQEAFQRPVPGVRDISIRIYHPKQVRPDAPQNQEVERLVREVLTHSQKEDLHLRFFGLPDVEVISARLTGRRRDPYEQPRDLVLVAVSNDHPVGYTDLVQDPPGEQTAEIAMLVRSDRQRQGIGEAMVKKALEEARKEGIRHLKGYLHPDNYKMKQALTKWSDQLHLHVRKQWEAGELMYVLDV